MKLSKITCIADYRLSSVIDSALLEMKIPEVLIQRGKQVSILDRSSLFRTKLIESRSDFWSFNIPTKLEKTVARRIAYAADLYLPGRGTLIAEDIETYNEDQSSFDENAIISDKDVYNKEGQAYTVICCIVMRGLGESISAGVLDMGLCVPAVSFGKGMGLRNKLGLLRITIPVDKEILYFVVPDRDADLLEGVIIHKAHLDRPGQGIIFRYPVRAYAVNLRMRTGKRQHAASMEQIITALDDMRGSSDWRRLGSTRSREKSSAKKIKETHVCMTITAEQGSVTPFATVAMDIGAGGATLVSLSKRSYKDEPEKNSARISSNARESCDLIITTELVEPITNGLIEKGLLSKDVHGSLELSKVGQSIDYKNSQVNLGMDTEVM